MSKVKFYYINKTKLSRKQTKHIKFIIEILKNNKNFINMKNIIISFEKRIKNNITPAYIRKIIQLFRETSTNKIWYKNKESLPFFIIANHNGYKISIDKMEINNYVKTIQARATSALKQIDQAWNITKRSWRYEKV